MLIHSAKLAIQQVFSKPCLVNLISKDTHLVFSMSILIFSLLRRSICQTQLKLIINYQRLLLTFANSLGPDQARQNVGPDLDPNCLTLGWCSGKNFSKQLISKKISRRQKNMQNYAVNFIVYPRILVFVKPDKQQYSIFSDVAYVNPIDIDYKCITMCVFS